jgi:hypothetical protein
MRTFRHLLNNGSPNNWVSLAQILHTNKSFTAHQISKAKGRSGRLYRAPTGLSLAP